MNKSSLKALLGAVPFAAEAYWLIRQRGQPLTAKFSLHRLQQLIPEWRAQAEAARYSGALLPPDRQRKVLLFASQRYWIEHVTLLGIALAGQGHRVTLTFMPYAQWQTSMPRFDARRHSAYAADVLRQAEPLVKITPLLTARQAEHLPSLLADAVRLTALRDTQYTLQVEDVDPRSDLYRLRLDRNTHAARAALWLLDKNRPDVVIIPNGTILEFGAFYHTARTLEIPVVTYEFGEQRQRLWLAQDAEVMRQETDEMWAVRSQLPLEESQLAQVRNLFAARQHASLWENFTRRWQDTPSEGGKKARAALGLDSRPIVLLATNVIGDSLTLGRQVFSDSMTDWLARTTRWFADHPEAQFVVRIHPGELVTKGPSVAEVIHHILPDLADKAHPENIHLVPADARVNTYDLVEIADLGLVYTTTVGLEMAMTGIPVIVVGRTHYRAKGFTLDPESWDAYLKTLHQVLSTPNRARLSRQQVDRAWAYAYRFFFDYPHHFPWHLLHLWDDLAEWPVARVLDEAGQKKFAKTFSYLVGEKVDWNALTG